MMDFTIAAVPFVMKIVVGIWVLLSILLILVVLMQKGRGGGLSSAFGGLGTSLLGTKTGDFLTWFTICLVSVWLILSVVAVKWFKPQTSEYLQPAPPVQQPSPAPVVPPMATETNAQQTPPAANEPEISQPNMPAQ